MGRKSRRKAKLRAAARLAQGGTFQQVSQPRPVATPAQPITQPRAAMTSAPSAITPAQANRYDYVIPELRFIGILSGILFAILIALTFILH